MIELNPHESRVLGVLVEKEMTTPEQYPLSLNAIVNGSNQKNNRDPITSITDNEAFDALESLRGKGLVIRVDTPGQRVNKYRHNAREVLRLRAGDIALITELLLRGPQTLGELRGRASRMHPFESLEATKEFLRALIERDEPFVRLLPPSPGSRAERYMQLLSPNLHPVDAPPSPVHQLEPRSTDSGISERVGQLEAEVATLKAAIRKLATAVGEPDPIAAVGPAEDAPPGPANGQA